MPFGVPGFRSRSIETGHRLGRYRVLADEVLSLQLKEIP